MKKTIYLFVNPDWVYTKTLTVVNDDFVQKRVLYLSYLFNKSPNSKVLL